MTKGASPAVPAQRPARFRIGSPALALDPAVEPINAVVLLAQIDAANRYARTIIFPRVDRAATHLPDERMAPSTASAYTRAEIRQEREDLAIVSRGEGYRIIVHVAPRAGS